MSAFSGAGSANINRSITRKLSLALLCLGLGITGLSVCGAILLERSWATLLWGAAAFSTLLILGSGFFLVHGIARPLIAMIDIVNRLSADGNAAIEVGDPPRSDEAG